MFRRIALTVAMVATLAVAGLGVTSTAEARHGCGRGGYGGYYGAYYPQTYGYYPPVVYRSSYYPADYYYGPVYYPGHRHRHHHHDHGGVHFSVGF
jgi:hypothetical protein